MGSSQLVSLLVPLERGARPWIEKSFSGRRVSDHSQSSLPFVGWSSPRGYTSCNRLHLALSYGCFEGSTTSKWDTSKGVLLSFARESTCDSEGEAMQTDHIPLTESSSCFEPAAGNEASCWFAVHTRSRHEKLVDQRLRDSGVPTFLPLIREVHRWSDRRKIVESPLFSCYVFAKLEPNQNQRLRVLIVEGVLRLVGAAGHGIPIPEEQLEVVRKLTSEQLPARPYPFLKTGQRVRVRGGALDGVEGILLSQSTDRTLVISVDAIQRSIAVRIEGYDLEAV